MASEEGSGGLATLERDGFLAPGLVGQQRLPAPVDPVTANLKPYRTGRTPACSGWAKYRRTGRLRVCGTWRRCG